MGGRRQEDRISSLERFVGRHTWKVFTALSVLIALFGLGDVIVGGATFVNGESALFQSMSGTSWPEFTAADPGAAHLVDYLVRAGGLHLLIVGLLSLAICLTALRRRKRWAWFAMTIWVVWLAAVPAMVLALRLDQQGPLPVPVISGTILLLVTVATLVLSFRFYGQTT